MPLANSFLRSPAEFATEAKYPLDVAFCPECSLVQLVDVIDPGTMFNEYLYVTGTSETIAEHNQAHALALIAELGLGAGDLVAEIASNDGSLLRWFKSAGVKTLGIEPASNLAEIARAHGIETVSKFFHHDAAQSIVDQYGHPRVVIAKNVLAHVDDPLGFLRGCGVLVGTDGLVSIEVPYLGDMLDQLEYDTVYHEHHCYFSITSLLGLCDGAGLAMQRVERFSVHGGSIRLTLRSTAGRAEHCGEAIEMSAAERGVGMTTLGRYEKFAADVARNRDAMSVLLEGLRDDGQSIAAYGAPAKGNTLLNYCAIDTNVAEFTVDKNPLKVGLFTPGMHLPVMPVETLVDRQPSFTLLLPWNLADEIRRQQRVYESRGGRFIIPIPTPRIAE